MFKILPKLIWLIGSIKSIIYTSLVNFFLTRPFESKLLDSDEPVTCNLRPPLVWSSLEILAGNVTYQMQKEQKNK